jgi:phosphoribosylglycinamide formyltransferase 1
LNKTLIFLCSGGGGNLRFIVHAMRQGWISRWSNVVVIADRQCAAIDFAHANELENAIIDFEDQSQKRLLDLVASYEPDLIITTVHRILGASFVAMFKGRLLNLHYSLLPAFSGVVGVKPVKQAIEYGVRFAGVTVHEVTENVDAGRPLVQAVFPLSHTEDFQVEMDLIFRIGCLALLTGLRQHAATCSHLFEHGHVQLRGRTVLFSPFTEYTECLDDEGLWQTIKT